MTLKSQVYTGISMHLVIFLQVGAGVQCDCREEIQQVCISHLDEEIFSEVVCVPVR